MILNHFQVCSYNEATSEIDEELSKLASDFLKAPIEQCFSEPFPMLLPLQMQSSDSTTLSSSDLSCDGLCFANSTLTSIAEPICNTEDSSEVPESCDEPKSSSSHKQILSRKGKFTSEEDVLIKELVAKHGRDWSLIAKQLPGKNRKKIKERFDNFLSKKINRMPFSEAEDQKILDLVNQMGAKFYKIAENIEGRTAVMIKNRYYAKLKHKSALSVN
jgi:hypothetical protein